MNITKVEDVRFETSEHKTKGSKRTDHDQMSSQTIDLFRKYLLTKSHNRNVGKTNKEDLSDVIKNRSPPRALIPLMSSELDCKFSRPLSLLERQLLPGIRCDEIQTSTDDKSSKAQLTIFYAGVVNVYDDVSAEKAQAIMLLAGERSWSRPRASHEKLKTVAKTPLNRPNVESPCKLQAEIPIARKISLQHFLEKRRRRMINNSPYAPVAAKAINRDEEKENELNKISNQNNNHSVSLSPFPSRLGFFSPVPTNRGCQA
ncbi:hypothetical protein DITRI_Ditri08aG0163900 [Diplodiscus trichospermus]